MNEWFLYPDESLRYHFIFLVKKCWIKSLTGVISKHHQGLIYLQNYTEDDTYLFG